jgi:hypothetical protein
MFRLGTAEARAEGYAAGYDDGYAAGYDEGGTEATAASGETPTP